LVTFLAEGFLGEEPTDLVAKRDVILGEGETGACRDHDFASGCRHGNSNHNWQRNTRDIVNRLKDLPLSGLAAPGQHGPSLQKQIHVDYAAK
jgi:hypothetical protein